MENGAEYWVRRAEANIGCRLERILGEDDIGFVDINFALSVGKSSARSLSVLTDLSEPEGIPEVYEARRGVFWTLP